VFHVEREPDPTRLASTLGRITRWIERPLTVRDPLRPAEVIVVPGARVRPDGTLSRSARERVHAAAGLHREGWAPLVLLSGGAPVSGFIEAAQMAEEAVRQGVPRAALILETNSRNSWENADFSATVLRRRRLTRAVVVTHGFHTRRIKRAFLRRGILVSAFPVPESWMHTFGGRQSLELLAREYISLAIYFTGGRK
jgi:uncharacterized SAM-binding protein YcdF (DUF218 family)